MKRALLLLALAACDDEPSAATARSASASASAAPPTADPWREPLKSPAAFDLIARGDGALLAWAHPGDATALRAAEIDAEGDVGAPFDLATTEQPIVEVALGTSTAGTAAVWSEGDATGAELRTVTFDTAPPTSPPTVLGPTTIEHAAHRGQLAVTGTPTGGLVAYGRGEAEPCETGGQRLCATFRSHRLPADGSRSRRPPLVLPRPCTRPLVGYAFVDGRYDYAVCNRDGDKPALTLFTVQPEPQYAQAETLMAGCAPVGLSVLDDDVWVTAQCGSIRTAQRLRGIDLSPQRHALDRAAMSCDDGAPVIDLGGGGKHRLTDPTDHLAAVLPEEVARDNAAAVWTGETLLVAHPEARHLELRRYRCIAGAFVRER